MSSAETVSTSFRVSKDKIERIDAIATSMGRSRNWLLNKALDDILEHQAWFVAEVQKGIAAADKGEFASPEEVTAIFNKYGA
ncbi:MAG: CopG family transcriptional regulator [Desulfomicrobium sp.]|nr:CopG family transcriptional regulator [Pseudomonadota bacterium]MBV1713881.1 CopG family transcriptional regulator [Desulfomicrobium sp.]MBU4572416.1 CopG family transcriptional regulator [Pseudomonadota bacterium]MBU4594396.1 CopG family transcriptional regulator [Pseudomonadota bacterium]MBV1719563.1 CopG family transcriptional regulator [Desulfomicrobium sp.]